MEEDTWENRKNLENVKELVKEFERKYGEEVEELRNRSWKKKRRNLVGNYLGSSWQNCYIVGKKGGTKEKGKRDGMRTGVNRKIPRDEET